MCPSGSDPRLKSNPIFDFRQAFNVLDTDKDGKISRDDLKSFYSNFSGANLANDEDIGSMISVADWNKNGFVEFDEFEKVLGCQKNAKTMNNTSMEDVFKVMDRDGDGKIGFDDLKDYLKWAGVSANDDDVKAMIKLGGGEEKEGVGYQGLLKILAINHTQEF